MTTKSKTCVVFGVGPGIGVSLVKLYRAKGFNVIAISRSEDKLKQLLIKNGITDTEALGCDAVDLDQVQSVMSRVVHKNNDIHTFIYNAAAMDNLGENPTFHKVSALQLVKDINASVTSAFLAAQIVLPQMKERKSGYVLFTGGGLSLYPSPVWGTLSMGKSGVRTLAHLLNQELKVDGVLCGTVTILGMVNSTPQLTPDKIASAFFNFEALSGGQYELQVRD